jgi:hypothetical protein
MWKSKACVRKKKKVREADKAEAVDIYIVFWLNTEQSSATGGNLAAITDGQKIMFSAGVVRQKRWQKMPSYV